MIALHRHSLLAGVLAAATVTACSSSDVTASSDESDAGKVVEPDAGKVVVRPDAGIVVSRPDAQITPISSPDASRVVDGGRRTDGSMPPPIPADGSASVGVDAGMNVCQRIGAACSKVDPGSGPVHECTVLQDSSDLEACNAALDGCESLCGKSICVRLGSICHDVDPGSGPLHDCHFGGHAGVASWCFDNAVHCYAICEAAMQGQE
ncbi:MAG TPA: hypothetical protein VH062_31640 [Polyangiaceae bacterium]|jgi:hypothetical protein|nr:hypothetical protein [Polyangiaceae bacterium]